MHFSLHLSYAGTVGPDRGAVLMELDRIALYRFRVRTADGREAVSRTVAVRSKVVAHLAANEEREALESGAQPNRMLSNPRWSSESFAHHDRATVQVDAAGLEGRTVKFVIERRDEDQWVAHDTLTGEVRGGVAEAVLEIPHPTPDDADAAPADFRFSCELA